MLSFLNAKDQEILRDHLLQIIETAQMGLRMLNRGQSPRKAQGAPSRAEPTTEGAWRDHPASNKQIATLEKFNVQYRDGLTKGEAADIIKSLFARRDV